MRADRLISILLLLQKYGRMTARQMAVELEVSERTIYRDIDALSVSGIPIFSECGPGGGFDLLENYRVDLMGLNEHEIHTLLMLSIPEPFKDLGIDQELKNAFLKLSTAVSNGNQRNGSRYAKKIHFDSIPWTPHDEQLPHLHILHQALIDDLLVEIKYQGAFDVEFDLITAPLGMVAKTNIWYLVCKNDDHKRVLRISKIKELKKLEVNFTYPSDFDLIAFWENWCKYAVAEKPCYPVLLYISPRLFNILGYLYSGDIEILDEEPGEYCWEGWKKVKLTYESLEEARNNILGFGCAAEVIEPYPLRMTVIDYAHQISRFYEETRSLS